MKDKILSILFINIILLFLISSILLPDKEISVTERRKLKQMPSFSINTLLNGEYFKNLNDYLVEQFPLREELRKLKGITSTKLFRKQENNGIFIKDDTIYQLENKLDEKSVNNIINKIKNVKENYLKTDNIYYSIIPDKNYYLLDKSIPKLDYNYLEKTFQDELQDITYINIFDKLTLDSYYKTDIHWRQEKLENVLKEFQSKMNLSLTTFPTENNYYDKFYGALYGRIASNIEPDKLTYLSDNSIKNAHVYNYEKNIYENVYNEKYLHNIDSYDIFLSGATPLLIIENPNSQNDRELIMFRDSFGSSLTPLLISNYRKITLIDLRYISSSLLGEINEINLSNINQDILFLYSVPIINNSYTLK